MYINTETLEWPISETEIKALYPNTSFPSDFIAPEPFKQIYGTAEPSYNIMMEGVKQVTPTLNEDGRWLQTWQIYELTSEQIAANEEQARQDNKRQAESLLQQTDWTESPSARNIAKAPHLVNGDEFDDYRVALRAIAINPTVMVTEWPEKPEEVWTAPEVIEPVIVPELGE